MASQAKLIEELRARVAELEARLAALEPAPGSTSGQPGEVRVGGQPVRLRPLSPAQWVLALKELPGFLLAYAVQEARGQEPEEALLERLVNTARQWVVACAIDPCDPAMLTIPEAQQVLVEVSRQNGLDAQLAEFFRQRLGQTAGSGSAALRSPPQPDARAN
ncbi:conserved hypothetical protein [Allomeiothermus silvanus DSM 9946]|uniref:Uncharacterized protein n=1 Tax=Allomeiothermus silvanus (strain ATCC 700542 / DSM 9946 / NBRC 106475 / NCIMB 13440 / VI-R2) TaxID=526227 RepID=D7BDV7_ALLS1|nr:hypothetical protein [Allomeiothermus silvanus]ADH63108.1 conserved hypothetical protein [Allomeiothermus silvanus DSM 9946]